MRKYKNSNETNVVCGYYSKDTGQCSQYGERCSCKTNEERNRCYEYELEIENMNISGNSDY